MRRRWVGGLLVLLFLAAACSDDDDSTEAPFVGLGAGAGVVARGDGSGVTVASDGAPSAPSLPPRTGDAVTAAAPDASVSGTSAPPAGSRTTPGVSDETIKIAYVTAVNQDNPYFEVFPGVNLNDVEAVETWVEYINTHAGEGATFMGFPFDLHGRKLELVVVEAGDYRQPEAQRTAANRMVTEIKPFVSFGGGVTSIRICPFLAEAEMLFVGAYDLSFDLLERTDGYCLPFASFAEQIDATTRFLANRMSGIAYDGPEPSEGGERRYGVVYSELPDLEKTGPVVAKMMKGAGLPIASVISMSGDYEAAAQQAPNVVAQLRAARVNTIITIDAIVPLILTHAADSQGYYPDWYVWPCSGIDVTAQARFHSQAQWQRAFGLTCWDADAAIDLFQDDRSRRTEWYAQYQSVDQTDNPPATAPLRYQDLLPILVGITNAGPNLDSASFLAGLDALEPYRYSMVAGRTDNPGNMLLVLDRAARYSRTGDYAHIRWNPTRQPPGGRYPGDYEFPDGARRYRADEL